LRNGQNTQLSEEKLRISRQQEVKPERSPTGKKLLKMPAEIKLIPRTGKKPFMWRGPEFDMSMRQSMISDNLESSLGMMEVVTPPGPVGLTDSKGRDLP
jgi:hypothetical protein